MDTNELTKRIEKLELERSAYENHLKLFNEFISAILQTFNAQNFISNDQLELLHNKIAVIAMMTSERVASGDIPTSMRNRLDAIDRILDRELKLAEKRVCEAQTEKTLVERAAKAVDESESAKKQRERMEHAKIESKRLGIPRENYLDDGDLNYYTFYAPDDHALELVALAYIHRDFAQLEEDGYEELDSPRKGSEAKYALNYIKELREGTREYQFVLTSGLFESDSLEMNDEGTMRIGIRE